MEERLASRRLVQKGVVNRVCRQRGRQRQVTACDPFGETQEIRRDRFLLTGQHRPRAPESDRDLIRNQRDVILPGQPPEITKIAGWMHQNPRRPLNQRLHNERRELFMLLPKNPLHFIKAELQVRLAVAETLRQRYATGDGTLTVSNSSFPYTLWNSGMLPTLTAPTVSPW